MNLGFKMLINSFLRKLFPSDIYPGDYKKNPFVKTSAIINDFKKFKNIKKQRDLLKRRTASMFILSSKNVCGENKAILISIIVFF